MTTKELIKAEIDGLSDERLDELYKVIKSFPKSKTSGTKSGLLSRLKRIQIDGPKDFATNLDLYVNGEKCVE
jgi:hypothetical protein